MSLAWRSLIGDSKCLVAGRWVAADSGAVFPVVNPATGEKIAEVPACGAAETERAIEAANEAQPAWAALPCDARATVIRAWADQLRLNRDSLSELITAENGKLSGDAMGEVNASITGLEWYAEEARRTPGQILSPLAGTGRRMQVTHQPVGVVGVITPWNFPLSMITRKVGAALAAGCAVVIKPAEDTPLSALAAAKLATESAGLPERLMSVVTAEGGEHGAKVVGETMCDHPLVRQIGFTGSSPVGRALYTRAAAALKRVNLELGGNAPFIVFRSANLDKAVDGLLACKFRCSGQTCISANRVFVHQDIREAFVERLTAQLQPMRLGEHLGPLINRAAQDKVANLVSSSVEQGARIVFQGERNAQQGFFVPATLLDHCTSETPCVKNEVFGPVLSVIEFQTSEEVVRMANETAAGLAGYFYTEEISEAWKVAEALKVGMVGVNETKISTPEAPFGGVKDSGIGREGGPNALHEFMDTKYTCWGGI